MTGWALEYRLVGEDAYLPLASGTGSLTNALAGTLDTTLLPNDTYELHLVGYTAAGGTLDDVATVMVAGGMKIGNMSFSVVDMTVSVGGFPITMTRTYDSRDTIRKKTGGDFGVGWSLSIAGAKVQKNNPIDKGWIFTGTGLKFTARPFLSHLVTVTTADGRTYSFAAALVPDQGNILTEVRTGHVNYVPVGSTPHDTRLIALDTDGSALSDMVALGNSGGGPNTQFFLYRLDGDGLVSDVTYEPTMFQMTLHNGVTLILDGLASGSASKGSGLLSITDRSGNYLKFTPGGITSYSADGTAQRSVVIARSGSGNYITSITDANKKTIYYTQTGDDLTSVTNRVGDTTKYTYDGRHFLTGIIDPRGIQPIRNIYDDGGRLVKVIDAYGKEVNYSYDLLNQGETIYDKKGHASQLLYDSNGNTTKIQTTVTHYKNGVATGTDNVVVSQSFDLSSLNTFPEMPRSRTDALGHTTYYQYNDEGNTTRMTDALGNASTYDYNAFGQRLTMTDALGNKARNEYDPKTGVCLKYVDALGHVTLSTYDISGRVIRLSDANGNGSAFEYNGVGLPARITEPSGKVTEYVYNPNGSPTAQRVTWTNAAGQPEVLTTQLVYDDEDRLTQRVETDGTVSSVIIFNEISKIAAAMDAGGRVMSFVYDDMSRISSVQHSDGTGGQVFFDENGRKIRSIDERGLIRETQYDELGRAVATFEKETGGAVLSSSYAEYDVVGHTLSGLTPRGKHTPTATYDVVERPITTTDTYGSTSYVKYNTVGLPQTVTDSAGKVVSFFYDAAGRTTDTSTPIANGDVATTHVVYDAIGQVLSQTDPTGRVTQYEYDGARNLIAVTDSGTNRSTFQYNELGQKISQTDANNHTTRFAFDSRGRLVARKLPMGETETLEYYLDNLLKRKTDFNGHPTDYTYEAASGRLLTRAGVDGTVSYTYWPDGSRKSATKNGRANQYYYDVRARMTEIVSPVGTIDYGYDADGNRASVTFAGKTTLYDYDDLNRLVQVTLPDGRKQQYKYDGRGNRVRDTRPNGVVTDYAFDDGNRMTGLTNSAGRSFGYTLDAAGRRVAVTDSVRGTTNYTLDPAARLAQESGPDGTIAYGLDKVGNRVTKTVNGVATGYTYDADDRMRSEGGATFDYDANGNLTRQRVGGVTTELSYDFEDMLLGAKRNGVPFVSYLYDGGGNRVEKSSGGVTTDYLNDGGNVASEYKNGQQTTRYEYGESLITADRVGGASSYYVTDGLGSTIALTDGNGMVTDEYVYDAFGLTTHLVGNGLDNPFLFNGQQFDVETGLYYLRARYYAPGEGRFVSQDPFGGVDGSPMSLHRYLYANDDPVNYTDPDGDFAFLAALGAMTCMLYGSVSDGAVATTTGTVAITNTVSFSGATFAGGLSAGTGAILTGGGAAEAIVPAASAVIATGSSTASYTLALWSAVATGGALGGTIASITAPATPINAPAATNPYSPTDLSNPANSGPEDEDDEKSPTRPYYYIRFDGVPVYKMNKASIFPEVSRHIIDSMILGYPYILSRERDPLEVVRHRNEYVNKASVRDATPGKGSGNDLDEYPFASSKEGGVNGRNALNTLTPHSWGHPSVRWVNLSQNRRHGGDLRIFYLLLEAYYASRGTQDERYIVNPKF